MIIGDVERHAQLWLAVEKFIDEQRISCPETISQSDRVIENAYDFIEQLCDIVGYYEYEDEE